MRSERPYSPKRSVRRAVLLLVASSSAVAVAVSSAEAIPSGADPDTEKRRVDAQVEVLREQLDDTNADLAEAYVALQTTRSQLPDAQAVWEKTGDAARVADRALAVADQEFEVALATEEKAQTQLAETTTAVTQTRVEVGQFASQIYQEQGTGQFEMALTGSGPQEFADRIALISTVMDLQSVAMERLATERADLTAVKDRLSALRSDSASKRKQAETALADASRARDAAADAKSRLDRLAASQVAQAKTVEGKLAGDKARLAQLEADQARLKKVLALRAAEARRRAAQARKRQDAAKSSQSPPSTAGGAGGSGGSSTGDGYLSRPNDGRISSEFGMRFHPIYRRMKLHSGRDYADPCGSPIRAAADGTVIMAGDGGGYGNRVVIDHGIVAGKNLATTYNHMQSIQKGTGSVLRGQIVGYIGTTGTSTGCHLHFETLEEGEFVDPRKWL